MIELTTRQKFAYGFGGFGKNLAYGLVASYTLYYYNSVLGISAGFVGILLMIARIFDACNDPFMGVVVAKTESKYGRYKPWILTGSILNAFIMFAMFTVPLSLTGTSLRVYIAVTYLLCGITYTLSDIPFWAIIPAVTGPGRGRESLSSFARILAGIGAGIPAIVTVAMVHFLGNLFTTETTAYTLRIGFSLVALIFSIIYVVTSIITVKSLPNGELSQQNRNPSIKELLLTLIKNDLAISVSLIIVLFTTATYLTTNLVLYIFQFDIQHEEYYTAYTAVIGAVQVVAMFMYSFLRRRFSFANRTIFFIAAGFGIGAYLLFFLEAFCGNYTIIEIIIPGICVSMANGLFYVMITIFISEAVDYGERKSGIRENSMISSLQTLMSKLSSAFAVFFAGIGIDLAKINRESVVQTPESQFILRLIFSVPSLILMITALIIFLYRKELGRKTFVEKI